MPGTPTPNYGWPIPALTDPPDGPAQIGALGNAVDATLKGQLPTTFTNWTPSFLSFTLGNGVIQTARYRIAGGLCFAYIRINAAASAPTTAFVGAMGISSPLPSTGTGSGNAWFNSGGFSKAGVMFTSSGTYFELDGIRQTDLCYVGAGSVWGATPWPVGSYLIGTIIYPI